MTPRAALLLVAGALAAGNAALLAGRRTLRGELDAMEAASDSARAGADDAALAAEIDRIRLALERARARPQGTATPHLALALSDSLLTLERGDVVLRSARVVAEIPRGIRVVEAVEDGRIVLEQGIIVAPDGVPEGAPAAPPGDERAVTIRVSRADFAAIRPNLRPGLLAYVF